ncbi:MAG: RagB/SusD family nutrient uptake outer membrane protein [Bacteroidales bacterium]
MKFTKRDLFCGILILVFAFLFSSCEDFLSSIRNENTQEVSSLLYSVDDLDVCINGAYGAFCANNYYGNIQLFELLGSDCPAQTLNSTIQPDFNSLTRENYFFRYQSNVNDYQAGILLQWASFVSNNSNIVAKSIMQHLPKLVTNNDSLNANRLLGEAFLMRATVEYYNNYFVGRQYHATTLDSMSTLYRKNPILSFADMAEPRKTVRQVYDFLESDLRNAKSLLPDKFEKAIHPSAYQFRCKKDVATAMLAKVFFQENKFDSALVQINELLGNTSGFSAKFPLAQGVSYSKIFQTTDKVNYQAGRGSEMIMAFHGNSAFLPTTTSIWSGFQWTAFNNLQNGDLTQARFRLVFDSSFRGNWLSGDTAKDIRFKQLVYITNSVGKESPSGQWTSLKFAYPTSNIPWLRAAEFHLMRAEIYLHKDKLPLALLELNLIRIRAGLTEVNLPVSKKDLYKLIIDERARELYFENVRRWDNLRLASLSGSEYSSYLPEPYKSGRIPLGYRLNLIQETELPWNANRLYSPIPNNEYLFNPAL